ncbi:meprin 1 beta [Cricetulus griseus]
MLVKDIDEGIERDIFDINEALGLDLFEGDIRLEVSCNEACVMNHKFSELNAKGVILNAFERYRLKTCIDFKPWSGEANYISVFKGSGCWSSVGNRHVGKQELSIGANCDRIATVQHEFLHALGFWHEQSRSDRDDYVTIVWDRILSGREHNFNIYDDSSSDSLNVPYDYPSVMHYSKTAFQNGTEPTIVTRISDFEDVIGQRMDFSDYDLMKLNRLYNCSSSFSFMDSCDFELENICGMIQSPGDSADWQRVSQVLGGPENDHSNMGQCKDSGFFMYFNTSSVNEGDTAMLESRMLYPKIGFQCLEFYLYNSGNESDQVNIYTRVYTAGNPDGVLTLQREIKEIPTGRWQLYYVTLQVTEKFRVAFEGLRSPGSSSGGLSIDDINLSETRCPHHIWHIQNFTQLLVSQNAEIHSPPYYSPKGYAYQIYLKLNSLPNVGIYFHLISGANDDQLQWPCPWQQATMTLLDQKPDIRQRMSNQLSITTDPTMTNDISHLNSTGIIPDPVPPSTSIVPDPVPTSTVQNACSEVECQNGGICTVHDDRAECKCPAGEDWWYMGKRCEKRGSPQDTIVIAVASTVTVFAVMLIITLVSVYCTRRKYPKGTWFINVFVLRVLHGWVREVGGSMFGKVSPLKKAPVRNSCHKGQDIFPRTEQTLHASQEGCWETVMRASFETWTVAL